MRSKSLRHNPLVRHKNRLASFKLFLYVLPGILLILLFHYVPLWGWSFAFFRYKPGLDLAQCPFVGLENFTLLFSNPIMRNNLFRVLRNTFGIHLLGYLFSPLPMLFAVFLSELSSKRYQKIVQVVTTLPNFISWVIMFSLASSLFGSTGLINTLLSNAGVSTRINLLNSDEHVWLTQVLLQTWKNTGWSAIIYFSALAGISPDLYEAAMVDGASRMQRIWHITLPGLIPTYFVLLIISIGNFLNTGIDQYMAFGNALNKEYIEVLDLVYLQPRYRKWSNLLWRGCWDYEIRGSIGALLYGEYCLEKSTRNQCILTERGTICDVCSQKAKASHKLKRQNILFHILCCIYYCFVAMRVPVLLSYDRDHKR